VTFRVQLGVLWILITAQYLIINYKLDYNVCYIDVVSSRTDEKGSKGGTKEKVSSVKLAHTILFFHLLIPLAIRLI
jgi:hypothetical protein